MKKPWLASSPPCRGRAAGIPRTWSSSRWGWTIWASRRSATGSPTRGIAFFPEHYGEYIIPAVAAVLKGQPIPPYLYVDNVVITKDNIDKYYPKK